MLIVVALTICMTWVYNNTQGSLVIAILLHASMNASLNFYNLYFAYSSYPTYDAALTVVLIAAAILVVTLTERRLSYRIA